MSKNEPQPRKMSLGAQVPRGNLTQPQPPARLTVEDVEQAWKSVFGVTPMLYTTAEKLTPALNAILDGKEQPIADYQPDPKRCEKLLEEAGEIDERDDGEKCQACGNRYETIYRVPNEVWAKITPKPESLGKYPEHQYGGLLCPACADKRARENGIILYWDSNDGDWTVNVIDGAYEKQARIYYQDIVYAVCNLIDKAQGRRVSFGEGVVCGTVTTPSTEVQDELENIIDSLSQYRRLFEKAVEQVDLAFQQCSEHDAILPDFCSWGEDKFEAVPKLARAYKALKSDWRLLNEKEHLRLKQELQPLVPTPGPPDLGGVPDNAMFVVQWKIADSPTLMTANALRVSLRGVSWTDHLQNWHIPLGPIAPPQEADVPTAEEALEDAIRLIEHLGGNASFQKKAIAAARAAEGE